RSGSGELKRQSDIDKERLATAGTFGQGALRGPLHSPADSEERQRCGLWAADNVTEVKMEVAELLFAEAQRCWRNASIEARLFGCYMGGEEEEED
ncbi:hypothetical protein S245_009250, partial [Arachis hypogaea]